MDFTYKKATQKYITATTTATTATITATTNVTTNTNTNTDTNTSTTLPLYHDHYHHRQPKPYNTANTNTNTTNYTRVWQNLRPENVAQNSGESLFTIVVSSDALDAAEGRLPGTARGSRPFLLVEIPRENLEQTVRLYEALEARRSPAEHPSIDEVGVLGWATTMRGS